jgi:hypothetical protein
MDCVNHPGTGATAYCQNCGKAMCAACMRREPTGQVMCEPCSMAWHAARGPYVPPPMGAGRCPSPVAAALLGFIPGVGAMFNGQFAKGFLHVIIFAVLVSFSKVFDAFGIVVAAWVFYQVFDAYQTARAKCEGSPLPDPLGMNELVNWFGHEFRRSQGMPSAPQPGSPVPPPPAAAYAPPAAEPAQAQASNPYQGGYQQPFTSPAAGFTPGYPPPPPGFQQAAPPMPPFPPPHAMHWRRREPVAAIILIAMGVLFLLGEFSWPAIHFAWPVLLIGLGAWLFVRRMRDAQSVAPPTPPYTAAPISTPASHEEQPTSDEDPQGGSR